MTELLRSGESFVVWLDADGASGCSGRVEHVSTSRREAFETADELIGFLLASREPTTEGETDVEG